MKVNFNLEIHQSCGSCTMKEIADECLESASYLEEATNDEFEINEVSLIGIDGTTIGIEVDVTMLVAEFDIENHIVESFENFETDTWSIVKVETEIMK